MLSVTSWSCPTHIVIGAGSARHYLAQLPSAFVVADPALGIDADLVRAPGVSDEAFVRQIMDTRQAGAQVVAVGGGSILDPVRIAVAGMPTAGNGVALLPASPLAACDVVCIPSTIGTAAEASPVAVIDGSRMLISPALRARVAVLDPDLTANPDEAALRQGLIEPWARVVVPMLAGDGLLLQDTMAMALAQVLEELAQMPIDGQWRLSAALASAQTHTAFVALQRTPFAHVLWPVVMEYAAMSGLTKQAALAVLLPPWLRSKHRDDLASCVTDLWQGQAASIDPAELDRIVAERWPMFDAPKAADLLA